MCLPACSPCTFLQKWSELSYFIYGMVAGTDTLQKGNKTVARSSTRPWPFSHPSLIDGLPLTSQAVCKAGGGKGRWYAFLSCIQPPLHAKGERRRCALQLLGTGSSSHLLQAVGGSGQVLPACLLLLSCITRHSTQQSNVSSPITEGRGKFE